MREFAKSYIKFKLISKSMDFDATIDNFVKEKGVSLQRLCAELLGLTSFNLDESTLKSALKALLKNLDLELNFENLSAVYENFAKAEISRLKKLPNAPKSAQNFTLSFGSVDIEAIEAIKNSFYWTRLERNEKVSNKLKEIIEKVFRGDVAYKDLPEALSKELSALEKADEVYLRGLANHIMLQSQNIARVLQAHKMGAPYFKIVAHLDDRTTPVCRSMHGRLIKADQIYAQALAISNANTLEKKKKVSAWRTEPYYGKSDKLPDNFALPPYHFNCRTQALAVWIDEYEKDGVAMSASQEPKGGEVLRHIDKTGVERILTKENYENGYHSTPLWQKASLEQFRKMLNSINRISPQKENPQRLIATTDNNFVIIFDGQEIVTVVSYDDKKELDKYFKRKATKVEIIKRWWQE